jgi:hypothetical protein
MINDTVDMNALRFNQISILGAIDPDLSLFRRVYKHLIIPSGLLVPQPVADDGAAHRFAQLLGGLFLAASTVFLYSGSAVTGWSLAWVVILLAATNLFFGFCAGCFVYYQIARLRSAKTGAPVKEGL